jgi:hypothetical protein
LAFSSGRRNHGKHQEMPSPPIALIYPAGDRRKLAQSQQLMRRGDRRKKPALVPEPAHPNALKPLPPAAARPS